MATGYMSEIKLIEGLITAAETLGGEIIVFSFSGNVYFDTFLYYIRQSWRVLSIISI